jgi:hypothetical protein
VLAVGDWRAVGLGFDELGGEVAGWVVDGRVLLVPSVGVIVNTDSIMPATRHTARMLAMSGMMPAWPGMILRSRRRRLRARCSRW